MVTENDTTIPAAAQQLPAGDPVAIAIQAHRIAHATYVAALERSWRLIEAVDPDMDLDDVEAVRAKLAARFGATAPAEFEALMTAREASRIAGEAEDEASDQFEAVALTSPPQIAAYVAYAKEHAAAGEGAEVVFLHRALDRVSALLAERLAA